MLGQGDGDQEQSKVPYRDLADETDVWWSIDIAADHLEVKRATILRYIREGLKVWPGGLLRRAEVLEVYRRRALNSRATRYKKTSV